MTEKFKLTTPPFFAVLRIPVTAESAEAVRERMQPIADELCGAELDVEAADRLKPREVDVEGKTLKIKRRADAPGLTASDYDFTLIDPDGNERPIPERTQEIVLTFRGAEIPTVKMTYFDP